MPIDLKPGPVTGAIPGLLDRVPLHDAAQMRAERGSLVQHAAFVTVNRDFGGAAAENCAFAGSDVVHVLDLARRDEVGILGGDVQVLSGELLDGAKRLAGRVVEAGPRIVTT